MTREEELKLLAKVRRLQNVLTTLITWIAQSSVGVLGVDDAAKLIKQVRKNDY